MSSESRRTDDVQALPTIDDRPGADVLIFDGQCPFCTAQVLRLDRWDRGGRLAFLSLHSPIAAERYPDLTRDRLMQQMFVIDRAGTRRGGAEAVRYLSRRLPALWPLAPLLHIPFTLPVWRWLYGLVASRRYQLPSGDRCDDSTCQHHEQPMWAEEQSPSERRA